MAELFDALASRLHSLPQLEVEAVFNVPGTLRCVPWNDSVAAAHLLEGVGPVFCAALVDGAHDRLSRWRGFVASGSSTVAVVALVELQHLPATWPRTQVGVPAL